MSKRAASCQRRHSAAKAAVLRIDAAQAERELTLGIVAGVVPPLIGSLAALDVGDAEICYATARRLTLGLLTFLLASTRRQLPKSAVRQGTQLLARLRQAPSPDRRSLPQPAVALLGEFLAAQAGKSWRLLAPRLAATTFVRPRKQPAAARIVTSNERLAQGIDTLLASTMPELDINLLSTDPDAMAAGFGPRLLGAVHETLLGRHCKLTPHGALLTDNTIKRRQQGSYYTPARLTELLVERTVKPTCEQRLALDADAPSRATGFTMLDPAMGGGHFLTSAVALTTRLVIQAAQVQSVPPVAVARRLCGLTANSRSEPTTPRRSAAKLDHERAVKQLLLSHTIFGVDIDPDCVELARLSLWLDSGLQLREVRPLVEHLREGDSLFPESDESRNGRRRFDIVIGNPPYGTPASEPARRRLRSTYSLTRHNADLAAAFVERSLQLTGPAGRVGLVLPKPLTYSFAWRHLRETLVDRIEWICDTGRAWEDVLLEQVLMVFAPSTPRKSYRVAGLVAARTNRRPDIPRAWCRRFGVLLSGLAKTDHARLSAMQFADATVGHLCRTFRGLPWQRRAGSPPGVPIFGGRDLARWRLGVPRGFVSAGETHPRLAEFAAPKLMFQNIIAHIERPRPHVRLIGAFDDQQRLTLDTINNLVPRTEQVDLLAVLALLHAEPVNWLAYRVIYNGAIRTMHFDQYFLDKIPLPAAWHAAAPRLAQLARQALAITAAGGPDADVSHVQTLAAIQGEIDRVVASAYGENERPHATTS